MKTFKILTIVSVFLVLLIPLAFTNLKPEQISTIDNQKLPESSVIRDVKSLSIYLSRRIGFRTEMINLYNEANDKLLGEMIHPIYTNGQNGYIFFKTKMEEHDNDYLDSFANFISKMQKYVTDRGSYFLFVINPTKISVYRQFLPKGYLFTDYRISYLKSKLDELGINYIDNTQCMIDASKNEQVYNIKYDAGHWNDLGAFYGINSIYKKMQDDNINVNLLEKEEYTISKERKTTLPVSKFKINEYVPLFELKTKNYSIDDRYDNYIYRSQSYNYFLETTNNTADNSYNLLFFRGSYMNIRDKFVSNKFNHVFYVHNYTNAVNCDYYYSFAKPDIVLFEAVEYAIGEEYYPKKLMDFRVYNEIYDNFKDLPKLDFAEIDTNKIVETINKNDSLNIPLTKIRIPYKDFKYGYILVKENYYDFCYNTTEAYVSLNTDLLKNNNVQIVLISSDLKNQQIINIK